MNTTYKPVMKPVLATVVLPSPAVCSPYAAARSTPTATPATTPLAESVRSELHENGASTTAEIAKRRARKANSGYSSIAFCTWTNVTPQIAVTPTRARRGPGRLTALILYAASR